MIYKARKRKIKLHAPLHCDVCGDEIKVGNDYVAKHNNTYWNMCLKHLKEDDTVILYTGEKRTSGTSEKK